MKKELEHFYIGESFGGNQDWFRSFMMRVGGCGAETATDCAVLLAREYGMTDLYPFDEQKLTRDEYVDFAHIMEPYLKPRNHGIDRLDIWTDGFGKFLADRGESRVTMHTLDGTASYEEAEAEIKAQIDKGLPVVVLTLRHQDKRYDEYIWHWYILNGYDERTYAPDSEHRKNGITDTLMVKAMTYSEYEWVDLRGLWETGCEPKGGLILLDVDAERRA